MVARLPFIRSFSANARKKILFLGTPEVAAKSLKKLIENCGNSYEISGVVSQPAQMMGRGNKRVLTPSPVASVGLELGLRVITPEKASDIAFLEELEQMKPDLCITAAYGQYLPKRFLAIPTYGTLNVHPSLLPKWRGASPVQRSLEAGDQATGVSVLWTVSKMDAGPIVAQVERLLTGDEKAPELLDELFSTGTQSLIDVLPAVFSGIVSPATSMQQADESATKADKIAVEEAAVCLFKHSAKTIHNRIRGFAGWPGVWCQVRFGEGDVEKLLLVTTRLVSTVEEPPEEISIGSIVIVDKFRLFARCADGALLEILELQQPAKKLLTSKQFCNGLNGSRRASIKAVQL